MGEREHVETTVVRVVDHDVLPGVSSIAKRVLERMDALIRERAWHALITG